MNIGFFYVPYYPLTAGRSVHGYYLVKALKKRGHRMLSCLGDGNPDCTLFPRTKAGALALAREADVLYIRIACGPLYSFLMRATLLKLLRPFRLPVVWEINAPVEEVMESHPAGAQRDAFIRRENMKRRFFARFVDAAVSVSPVLQDYSRDFLRIKKSFCIPNGSAPELFEPAGLRPTPLEQFGRQCTVFWMGSTTTPWQGIERIIAIAETMCSTDPDVLFVVVAAEAGVRFPVLKNLLVLREMPHEDIPHFLKSADICLCLYQPYGSMPFGFYHSPLKLFDYMAAGKAVIASARGQIATVIKDGENGLLAGDDSDEIIRAIRRLKQDPALRARLGSRAREDVLGFYNWDRVAEETEKVLREVCTR